MSHAEEYREQGIAARLLREAQVLSSMDETRSSLAIAREYFPEDVLAAAGLANVVTPANEV